MMIGMRADTPQMMAREQQRCCQEIEGIGCFNPDIGLIARHIVNRATASKTNAEGKLDGLLVVNFEDWD